MSQIQPMRLCIHGHFYQPPRENPWTGELEAQESALPHHDWNERIARECYAPNGASRLLDSRGRIRGLVNNYRWMSFNFGPTLLEWMDHHDPETLERIKEADRQSAEDQAGHGNALAQVYNHVIMPLATDRDRRTQIAWGVREFRDRFGRAPEGMWLAETAIDMNTVVALIQGGIRFTVLAPTQADRVRGFGEESWRDVSDCSIDPSRPYRIYPLDALGEPLCAGHLDVFFYDGPISSAVGFEHLLRDAGVYHEKLKSAWNPDGDLPKIVAVGTDGESYGHHEPFGDMALAYIFESLAPRDGVIPTNFGHFLSLRPPVEEVRLKNAHGDGTAWSCAHGTSRWKADCGCSTGGGPGWNQAWRAPLREAMDLARTSAEEAWDRLSPELFDDPWSARVDWISTRTGVSSLSSWHAKWIRNKTPENAARASRLLELVRMGQFSLTSCAWFFDDLGGLEPVQNLRYALRVCELRSVLGLSSPESSIRRILSTAHSNVGGRTGDWIWDHWVKPALEPARLVVAQTAVRHLASPGSDEQHGIRVVESRSPRPDILEAVVEWTDPVTGEAMPFRAIAHAAPGGSSRAWVLAGLGEFPALDLSTDQPALDTGSHSEIELAAIEAGSFDLDTRRELAEARVRNAMDEVQTDLETLDHHTSRARADLLALHAKVPSHLSYARRILLEQRLANAIEQVLDDPALSVVERIRDTLEEAGLEGIELRPSLLDRHYDRKLQNLMLRIWSEPEEIGVATLILLLDLAEVARLPVSKAPLENLASRLRIEDLHPLLRGSEIPSVDRKRAKLWITILERLNFDMDLERELLGFESLPSTVSAPLSENAPE